MSQAITAKHPKEAIDGNNVHLQLMRENIKFAIISTKIEDSLAVSPLIDEHERKSLDNALVQWYQSSSVRYDSTMSTATGYSPNSASPYGLGESPGVVLTRNTMRWRCHLTRAILHRPALLWWAMRSRKFSSSSLSPQKRAAIDLCRSVTAELISDVINTWQQSSNTFTTSNDTSQGATMPAWHASGVLYQAVMVPLLSLFCAVNDTAILHASRQQVEATITALVEMSYWCKTAKRSIEVVSRLYEASRRHSPEMHHQQIPQAIMLSSLKQEPIDEHSEMLDRSSILLQHPRYAASTGSASASVSGGMGSGGLGTPATLPSTVSNNSHGNSLQQHLQQQHLQQQNLSEFASPQPQQPHQRPTFIDLPPVSTSNAPHTFPNQLLSQQAQSHPQGAPFLTTPSSSSADMFMDNMLDSLNWSQGWNNTEYPFETPRLGWDYQAMNGWVGGVHNGSAPEGFGEYFGQQRGRPQSQAMRGSVSATSAPGNLHAGAGAHETISIAESVVSEEGHHGLGGQGQMHAPNLGVDVEVMGGYYQ
jgi:hypothetical protein